LGGSRLRRLHLTFRYESIFKASERARERTNIRE
jgi:hypothetical protein